ncbi:MAG: hypothetical protein ACLUOF_00900 [Ruminococcus sp.]
MIPLKTAIADDDRYICQQIQECLMQYSTQDIDIDDPDIYTDCATLSIPTSPKNAMTLFLWISTFPAEQNR